MIGRKNIFTRTMNGFAKTVTKHPGKISLLFLLVTILMLQPISGISTQSNMADFMPESEFCFPKLGMLWSKSSTTPKV
jgi:predicted RND superfamily exporter protein